MGKQRWWAEQAEHWVLLLAVFTVPLVTCPCMRLYSTPKAGTILALASVLVGLWLFQMLVTGRIEMPASAPLLAAWGFAAWLFVSAAASGAGLAALTGHEELYNGALFYTALVVIATATARLGGIEEVRRLMVTLAAVTGIIGLAGVLEGLGILPFGWPYGQVQSQFSGIAITLGNPNYAAGFLAIAVPLLVVLWLTRPGPTRWLATCALVLTVAALPMTKSLQGLMAPIAGLGVLAVAVALSSPERRWKRVGGLLSVGLTLGVVLVTLGMLARGPLAVLSADTSVQSRRFFWHAALAMFRQKPLTGVGRGMFEGWYHTLRPETSRFAEGNWQIADTAHNVYLDLLATTGLGGLLYAGVILATLLTGWRVLRDSTGERRLLAAGLLGSWASYQAQSLVSSDTAPLALLNWTLIGAICLLAAPPQRTLRLFTASHANVGRTARAAHLTAGGLALGTAVLLGSWGPIQTVRAEALATRGAFAQFEGHTPQAFVAYEAATRTAPWSPDAPRLLAALAWTDGDRDRAIELWEHIVRLRPRDPAALGHLADAAQVAGQLEAALWWQRRAFAVRPYLIDIGLELAEMEWALGHRPQAQKIVGDILEQAPAHPRARQLANSYGMDP